MIEVSLIFKSISILVGAGLGFFSYQILRATQGASKGWLYASLSGLLLFLWSLLGAAFTIFDIKLGRVLTGIFILFSGTTLMALCFVRLAMDFKVKKPDWLNMKNTVFINSVLLVVLVAYNMIFGSHSGFLIALLSVEIFCAGVLALFGILALFYLWRNTQRKIWLALMLTAACFATGMFACSYPGGCCTNDGSLIGTPVCDEYELDYEGVLPLPCTETAVGIAHKAYSVLIPGTLMLLGCYFYLWKKLAR